MTQEPHWCPADCCEFGPGRSLSSVRSHVNAASSSGHDWHQLRDDVEAQKVERGEEQREASEKGAVDQRGSPESSTSRAAVTSVLLATIIVATAAYWVYFCD